MTLSSGITETAPAPASVPDLGHPLPAARHSSTAWYTHERETLLKALPWFMGHAGDVAEPGTYLTREVFGQPVIVIRGQDGRLRAFVNACLHRRARLTDKRRGRASHLVCPYHGWMYATDGRLMRARGCKALSGNDRLLELPLVEIAGLLFVRLQGGDCPFVEPELGAMLARAGVAEARPVARERLHARVNWKLWVENFLECLHCHVAHPELSSVESHINQFEAGHHVAFFAGQAAWKATARAAGWTVFPAREPAPEDDCFQFIETLALGTGRVSGTRSGAPLGPPLVGKGFKGGAIYGALGPCLHITVYMDHAVVFDFRPAGPEETDIEITWLTRGTATPDRQELTWLWLNTLRQDIALTENVQRNLRADVLPKGLYVQEEERSAAFTRWVGRKTQEMGETKGYAR